jgi:hypothetical protein
LSPLVPVLDLDVFNFPGVVPKKEIGVVSKLGIR